MPPKKVQKSIKEMLMEKLAKGTSGVITIPEILQEPIDIRAHPSSNGEAYVPLYECSEFAIKFIQGQSNFNDVLKQCWLLERQKESLFYEHYATHIMRTVTSVPLSRLTFPMNTFRFNSNHDEAFGRMLLMHPDIKEEDDLQAMLQFYKKNRLQLSTVSLGLDNVAHADALAYVRGKQRSQKTEALPVYSKQDLSYYIRRRHYKREGLTKYVFLVNLTVKELEKISSFENVVLRMMEKSKHEEKTDHLYSEYSEVVLDMFKTDTEMLLAQKDFAVNDPMINLICNVMTVDQQVEVSADMDSFYNRTNAKKECRKLRDGTTREQFFEMYRDRDHPDKKLVPYHRLCYKKPAAAATEVIEVAPRTQPIDRSSNISKNVARPSGPSTSAAVDRVSAKVVQQSARKPAPQQSLPQLFLNVTTPNEEIAQLAAIMCHNSRFVSDVKRELCATYKLNFEQLWKEKKKHILWAYIQKLWTDDREKLKQWAENWTSALEGNELKAILTRGERPTLVQRKSAPANQRGNVGDL